MFKRAVSWQAPLFISKTSFEDLALNNAKKIPDFNIPIWDSNKVRIKIKYDYQKLLHDCFWEKVLLTDCTLVYTVLGVGYPIKKPGYNIKYSGYCTYVQILSRNKNEVAGLNLRTYLLRYVVRLKTLGISNSFIFIKEADLLPDPFKDMSAYSQNKGETRLFLSNSAGVGRTVNVYLPKK